MSYSVVMELAKERPDQLPLVQAAYGIADRADNVFSASAVLLLAPGVARNLVPLSRRGIVVKTGEAKQGHRAYYRLVDPPGVKRALREFGLF